MGGGGGWGGGAYPPHGQTHAVFGAFISFCRMWVLLFKELLRADVNIHIAV